MEAVERNSTPIPSGNFASPLLSPEPSSLATPVNSLPSSLVMPSKLNEGKSSDGIKIKEKNKGWTSAPKSPALSPLKTPKHEPVDPLDLEDTILSNLQALFLKISTQKKRTGSVAPTAFVNKLKQENGMYQSLKKQGNYFFG